MTGKAIEGAGGGLAGTAKSVDAVLNEASGIALRAWTRAPPVSCLPANRTRGLKHIEFVRLEPERALVVLVSEDGQVENRVLTLPSGLPTSALTEATNFLNARIRRHRMLADARVEASTARSKPAGPSSIS